MYHLKNLIPTMTKLKRMTGTLAVAGLLLAPITAKATGPKERPVVIDEEVLATRTPAEQQRVLDLKHRMEQLMATDRKGLQAEQRREMRQEWRGMKAEMKELNRGGTVIYISGVGLILLIILLIILL
jgi:hypothetical protein